MSEVRRMSLTDDPKKLILMKFLEEPKRKEILIRENTVLIKLVKHLQERYNLDSKQKVFELAILSITLKIPPEKLASLLRLKTRADSKKSLYNAYELLAHLDF